MTIETFGLVLAGGLARRMGGGDKALIRIGSETILQRALARLAPQVSGVVLNANGDPARFASFGLPVVADSVPDFAGPLAGILAGLDWVAANRPGIEWIVSVPGDCPFLPRDLVARLHAARVAEGQAARLRAFGRLAPSGGRAVAGRAARGSAPRHHGGRPAQDRGVDRAPRRRARRLADRAGRSVLQRQHAGGCREGDALTPEESARPDGSSEQPSLARSRMHAISPPAPNTAGSRSSRPARSRSRRRPARQGRRSRSATRSRRRRPADACAPRSMPSARRVSDTRTYSRRPFFLR